MSLFIPKWKSSDFVTARRAIEKLKYGSKTREIVLEILDTDKRENIIFTALSICQYDDEFLKQVYKKYDDRKIRECALNFISDPEFLRKSIITEVHPHYTAVMSLSHHDDQKDFALDILTGKIEIGKPYEPGAFWQNVCKIIERDITPEDISRVIEALPTSTDRYLIEQSVDMFKRLKDIDTLSTLSGKGIIGPHRFFNGSSTMWKSEDYVKKCARDALSSLDIIIDDWKQPIQEIKDSAHYVYL